MRQERALGDRWRNITTLNEKEKSGERRGKEKDSSNGKQARELESEEDDDEEKGIEGLLHEGCTTKSGN